MANLAWNAERTIGIKGAIKYTITEPNKSPGWRVFCSFYEGMASIGGLLVTIKAPDHDAAVKAAEAHFRSFVAGLVGRNGVLELLTENERLRKALDWYAEQAEAASRHVPAKNTDAMTAILTVLSLDGGKRAKPTPPDSDGA